MRWTFEADDPLEAVTARRAYARFLRSVPAMGDLAMAELIYGELVSNVVRHAPGPIGIVCDWSAAAPVLRVRDRGPGVAGAAVPSATPAEPWDERGRGIYLVGQASPELMIVPRAGGGTEVSVILPLVRPVRRRERAASRPRPGGGDLAEG